MALNTEETRRCIGWSSRVMDLLVTGRAMISIRERAIPLFFIDMLLLARSEFPRHGDRSVISRSRRLSDRKGRIGSSPCTIAAPESPAGFYYKIP
ncbi:hypothetical protein FGF66_07095 [Chlorobaculum thiosulfatiphilum]|uniref:Uncharacterized protein n=1 Tax=Chlorobaculum thiosulfatiphilum TaxID=115852 RepID=A0A5C4S6F7_CHLTI|nr:hypothetical protein FGF66_07095 [Chlorobaculum thiosulfatiphilum]